jgi:curved DNA-binding protein CbpA
MGSVADACRILGVSEDSSMADITKAYRRLAKKYHPDSNPDNPESTHEMMMQINEAYRVLKKSRFTNLGSPKKQTSSQSRQKTSFETWYERILAKENERMRREILRKRKEDEALRRFWNKIAQEHGHEIKDTPSLDAVRDSAYRMVSRYYERNFFNTRSINLPSMQKEFDSYVEECTGIMKDIKRVQQNCHSKRIAGSVKSIFVFLKAFLIDAHESLLTDLERRSSALSVFQDSDRKLHHFFREYFSDTAEHARDAEKGLKDVLGDYEYFLKSFPDSPLIEFAERRIDLLEKFYHAFEQSH